MKSWKIFLAGIIAAVVLGGAALRETGKLYIIVDKSNQHVLRMGISPQAVLIQDATVEKLVVISGEMPTHLSENYFKLIDGELVDMTASEKAQVDANLQTEKDNKEVARLKAIMSRDPAGFRSVLGL